MVNDEVSVPRDYGNACVVNVSVSPQVETGGHMMHRSDADQDETTNSEFLCAFATANFPVRHGSIGDRNACLYIQFSVQFEFNSFYK